MHARVIPKTDARKGLFGHQYAQPERPFWRLHPTDFWATDARKVWGKSWMRVTCILDARNPFNRKAATSEIVTGQAQGTEFGSNKEGRKQRGVRMKSTSRRQHVEVVVMSTNTFGMFWQKQSKDGDRQCGKADA